MTRITRAIRISRCAAFCAMALAMAACSGATSPDGQAGPMEPEKPAQLDVPSFVFAADVEGRSQLFRFSGDSITRLTADEANDAEPRSAAGRIVFTSDRDGNDEIYFAGLDYAVQRRVTSDIAADREPALNPGGDVIAFVRNRVGTPRIWTVAAPALDPAPTTVYGTAVPLETGADEHVPEHSPVWSPDGSRIAFTSTRTGISQVFVVEATGGSAVQVTHEAGGAFDPGWSDDGRSIIYVAATGTPSLRSAPLAGGEATDVASDSLGIGQPSCALDLCVAITDPLGDTGNVVVLSVSGHASRIVLARTSRERQPAIVIP